MDIKQMLNKPKIAVVGKPDKLLIDGLEALEMKYDICETESACDKEFDLVIILDDMLDRSKEIVQKMNAVPVLKRAKTSFVNFDAIKESGNAFTYDGDSAWHIMEALIRAQETYRFIYDWKTVKANLSNL